MATEPIVPGAYPLQPPEPDEATKAEQARREARIAEARAELGENPDGSAKQVEPSIDPPVYDNRGNVRPRGTKGAKPMTFAERVKVAKKTGAHPEGAPTPKTEGEAKP